MDQSIKFRSKPLRISSPPTRHPSLGAQSAKKTGRGPSRTLGITNRTWLVIIFVFTTTLLLHHFLPGRSPPPLPSYASTDLHPKNYLNTSSSSSSSPPNPFPFCPSNGPSDTLAAKYGAALHSRTRNFQGTGYRVQRVLRRAFSGQPVTISVIGGSSTSSVLCPSLSDDALQYPLATVQVTVPFHQNVMSQNSLIGGTSSFLIRPRKSQTALCGEQIPTTSAFVAHTIFQMLQTLSSLSLIPMIPRMHLFSPFFFSNYLSQG